jgi:hypothetical protein
MKGTSPAALQSFQINCLNAELVARYSSSHGINRSSKAQPVMRIALLVSDSTLLLAVPSAAWFSALTGAFHFPEGLKCQLSRV